MNPINASNISQPAAQPPVSEPAFSLPVALAPDRAAVEFTLWLPGDAPLAGSVIAADTETTRIDREHPWLTPTVVLMQAYDGERGVFVAPEHVPAFMAAHLPQCGVRSARDPEDPRAAGSFLRHLHPRR